MEYGFSLLLLSFATMTFVTVGALEASNLQVYRLPSVLLSRSESVEERGKKRATPQTCSPMSVQVCTPTLARQSGSLFSARLLQDGAITSGGRARLVTSLLCSATTTVKNDWRPGGWWMVDGGCAEDVLSSSTPSLMSSR